MRVLLALVGIAALVVIALVAFGLLRIDTRSGSLPSVSVTPGRAPEVTANMATVELGTKTRTIEVPTVKLRKPAPPEGDADGNSVTAE